jgi:iron-sulfur cluster assembly accessory protein
MKEFEKKGNPGREPASEGKKGLSKFLPMTDSNYRRRLTEYEGVRVLVDATSAQYLVGTEIDFVSSLHGGGFKFSNPKATHTCGCGSSFNA